MELLRRKRAKREKEKLGITDSGRKRSAAITYSSDSFSESDVELERVDDHM